MTLRRAYAGDAGALFSLETILFKTENFPLSRRSFYNHIRNSLLLVAETESGEIAGYSLALIRRRDAKLYSLGVNPANRGGGIAALLLEKTLSELHALGFARTLLEVRCDNDAAIALYQKSGFGIVKILPAFYRDGCDAYLMEYTHAETPLRQTV